MTKAFQDMMTGLDEIEAYLASNFVPEERVPAPSLALAAKSPDPIRVESTCKLTKRF